MNFTEPLKKMADLVRVVPGEAAESDSEEEINTNAIAAASRLMTAPAKGAIVQGEASETESEEDDDDDAAETSSSGATHHHKSVVETFATQRQSSITPLKVEPLPLSPKHEHTEKASIPPPKYDTLLHRKLRDRNIALQDDICEAASEAFQYGIRELNASNQQLAKSQIVIQEVCHNLMVFSSDLKKMEETMDIINSSTNLPNFTIDVKGKES